MRQIMLGCGVGGLSERLPEFEEIYLGYRPRVFGFALRRLDKVAYVRFASVYRNFRDIDEFKHELNDLFKL